MPKHDRKILKYVTAKVIFWLILLLVFIFATALSVDSSTYGVYAIGFLTAASLYELEKQIKRAKVKKEV
jgi:hypothetical protein